MQETPKLSPGPDNGPRYTKWTNVVRNGIDIVLKLFFGRFLVQGTQGQAQGHRWGSGAGAQN